MKFIISTKTDNIKPRKNAFLAEYWSGNLKESLIQFMTYIDAKSVYGKKSTTARR